MSHLTTKKIEVISRWLLACLLFGWSYTLFAEEAGEAPEAEETAMAEEAPAADEAQASAGATAQTVWKCTHGNQVRLIEIVYQNPPANVPCEVTYTKETEEPGVAKSLWQATNNEGYCEEKAQAFVQKQEGWGWDCN